jgi:hypothetical protein
MAQDKTIIKCLAMLKAAYPRQQLADETIDVYTMALADVNPDLLRTAVLRLISRSVFFPTVAELRQTAADIAIERAGYPTALQAWEIALNRPKEATDEIKRAVRMICGDFYNLRMSTMQGADRARFIEAYGEIMNEKRNEVAEIPEVKAFLGQPEIALLSPSVNGEVAKLATKLEEP